jgi:hypothetical protein
MRPLPLAAALVLVASPALAQFPPPGVYDCADTAGNALGTLSLLVAGDYQWDTPDGTSATGQVTSAANSVEAQTGPLADRHWTGSFSTDAGETVFVFATDAGEVTCRLPPE